MIVNQMDNVLIIVAVDDNDISNVIGVDEENLVFKCIEVINEVVLK